MVRTLILLLMCVGLGSAHDVITTKITWAKEISRVVYKRCVMCHFEGGPAFSLVQYTEARPWAKAIKEEVLERRMPPWQAVKGFGEFRDDRGLTQEELELISDWVEGGAPEGNPKFTPAPPKQEVWMDPAVPSGATELTVSSDKKLPSAANVLAVRPKGLQAGATIQVLAVRPDGTSEPLLWIYDYKPAFERTYYYRVPVQLPAGTKFEVSPPNAGTIGLFTKKAVSAQR